MKTFLKIAGVVVLGYLAIHLFEFFLGLFGKVLIVGGVVGGIGYFLKRKHDRKVRQMGNLNYRPVEKQRYY